MKGPSFSVVVPVYNAAGYLRECIGGILRNAERASGAGVEILCVDDGSTDGSSALLDEIASSFAAPEGTVLRVMHKPNGGAGSARNAGLDAATGEWLLFVDADDVLRDCWLEDICRAVERAEGSELVGFREVSFVDAIESWDEGSGEFRLVDLSRCIPGAFAHHTIYEYAFRRSAFADMRFREYAGGGGEDLVYVAQALARAKSCLVLDKGIYGYRLTPGSAMRTAPSVRKMLDLFDYDVAMFGALAGSGKRIGLAFWLWRGNQWLEVQPRMILGHIDEPGWDSVWDAWLKSLEEARKMPFFSAWQQFVIRSVLRTRSRAVVRLLCLLPFWLNKKGILRRPDPFTPEGPEMV